LTRIQEQLRCELLLRRQEIVGPLLLNELRLLTIAALSPNFIEGPDRQGLPAARLLAI
jgi:hypothetical protein